MTMRKTVCGIILLLCSAFSVYLYTSYADVFQKQVGEKNPVPANVSENINPDEMKEIKPLEDNISSIGDIYIREDGIRVNRKANEELKVQGVEEGSVTEKIIKLQQEIEKIENALDVLHDDLFLLNNEIQTYKQEMRKNEDEKEEKQVSMETYLLWLYETTHSQNIYLNIFQAGNLRDLIYNYDVTKKFIEKLNTDILRINGDNKDLDSNRNAVVNQKVLVISLIDQQEELEAELVDKHNDLVTLFNLEHARLDSEFQTMSDELWKSSLYVSKQFEHMSGFKPEYIGLPDGGTNFFIHPVNGYVVTSEWGTRIHPISGAERHHAGIDLAVDKGVPVVASADGVVKLASWYGGYGKAVIIEHTNGFSTLYGHNSSLLVQEGDTVRQGQPIALAGSTGNSTGPHCHFEIRVNGKDQNPRDYLGF